MTKQELINRVKPLAGTDILLSRDLYFAEGLRGHLERVENTNIVLRESAFNEGTMTLTGKVDFFEYYDLNAVFKLFHIQIEVEGVQKTRVFYNLKIDMKDPTDPDYLWKLSSGFSKLEEGSGFPPLTDCIFLLGADEKVLELIKNDDDFWEGVKIQANLPLVDGDNNVLKNLKNIFGGVTKIPLFGDFEVRGGFPIIDLPYEYETSQELGPIAFKSFTFHKIIKTFETNGAYCGISDYQLDATIMMNNDELSLISRIFNDTQIITFELAYSSSSYTSNIEAFVGTDFSFSNYLPDNLSLPDQPQIKDLVIDLDLRNKIPQHIQIRLGVNEGWNINDDFKSKDIEIVFDITNPSDTANRLVMVTVDGTLEIAETTSLVLHGSYPEALITAELDEGSSIPIADLAEKFLPVNSLPTLDISALAVELNPKTKDYSLSGTLTNEWGLSIGGNTITLKEVSLEMSKSGIGVDAEKMAKIEGVTEIFGYQFSLIGEQPAGQTGWVFSGSTGMDQTISIKEFATKILDTFNIEVPLFYPDVQIEYFEVMFSTISKRFLVRANSASQFKIFDGEFEATSEVYLETYMDAATRQRKIDGSFMAEIELVEGFKFQLSFEMTDNTPVISGGLASAKAGESLSLSAFLKAFGLSLEGDEFIGELIEPVVDKVLNPLKLTSIAFEYDAGNNSMAIQAISKDYGNLIMVTATNPSATGGAASKRYFVIGLEFEPGFKLSQIPEIGNQEPLKSADFASFDEIALMISSLNMKGYSFPALPQFEDEDSNSSFLATASIDLTKGLNVAAKIALSSGDGAKDSGKSMSKLGETTGLADFIISAQVSPEKLNFKSLIGGDIGFNVGKDRLEFSDPFVQFDVLPNFGLQLGGKFMMDFLGTKILTEGALVISPLEVSGRFMMSAHKTAEDDEEIAGSVQHASANGNLLEPLGIHGLQLNSIGFIVGATFVPVGFKFGMQTAFQIGDQPPSANKLAAILQVIPAVPSPVINVQLLSFHLQDLGMREAMIVLMNDKSPSMPDFLQSVSFTDVGMFYCSTITTLPDGNTALPGFGFNAGFDILGFKGRAGLMISTLSGIEGKFQIDPLEIKVGNFTILSLSGNGKEIIRKFVRDDAGSDWKRLDNSSSMIESAENGGKEIAIDVSNTKTETIVSAGGPVLEFSSMGPRFLYGSARIELFETIYREVEMEIAKEGFRFKFTQGISDILTMSFDFAINWGGGDAQGVKYGFMGSASFDLDLDLDIDLPSPLGFDLGSIKLDTSLSASAMMELTIEGFKFDITGTFEFEGKRMTLPDLSVDITTAELADLAGIIFDEIKDKAGEIFKELIEELEKIFEAAMEVINAGIDAAEDAINAIGDGAATAGRAALKVGENAVAVADQAIDDIKEETKKALEDSKKFAEDVGKEIMDVSQKAQKGFENAVEYGKEVLEEAGEAVKVAGELATKFAGKIDEEITELATETAKAVEDLANEAREQAAKIIAGAEEYYGEVVDAAKAVAEELEKLAKELEKIAEQLWDDIEEFFKNVGGAVVDAAEDTAEFFEDTGKGVVDALSGY